MNIIMSNQIKSCYITAVKDSGAAEGREEGRAEGQIEACLENARNFKHLGVPIDIICQATGLSSEVVEGL